MAAVVLIWVSTGSTGCLQSIQHYGFLRTPAILSYSGNTSADLCPESGLATIVLYFPCLICSFFHPVCLWN